MTLNGGNVPLVEIEVLRHPPENIEWR